MALANHSREDRTQRRESANGSLKTVSIVLPVFNEEDNLPALRARLKPILDELPGTRFEIVLVDDHSTDGTRRLCREWSDSDHRVRYVRLSRNFGSHAALTAGLNLTTGDCAILLAADLQDPPELIPQMLDQWRNGFATVWAVRAARHGVSWFARLTSRLFWRLMQLGAREATPPAATDAVLIDRRVIDAFKELRSRNDSIVGAICWLGFDQTCVPYHKAARNAGTSGWTLAKRIKLGIDSVVGFSYWPIRLMSVFGIGCALLGFGLLAYFVWHRLTGRTSVEGWAGLMSAMLTGMGILMVMVGILGEYLWRVLDEARGRPRYVVEEHCGSARTQARTAIHTNRAAIDHPVVAQENRADASFASREIAPNLAEPSAT
jgi:dolichol-phosphate mannosyltransferase